MTWDDLWRAIDPTPIAATALMILIGLALFNSPAIMPTRPEEPKGNEATE